MTQEQLDKITETITGFEVKNLKYKPRIRMITGQVKDPYNIFPELHEGFVGCSWSVNGYPQNMNKGRKELKLKM